MVTMKARPTAPIATTPNANVGATASTSVNSDTMEKPMVARRLYGVPRSNWSSSRAPISDPTPNAPSSRPNPAASTPKASSAITGASHCVGEMTAASMKLASITTRIPSTLRA